MNKINTTTDPKCVRYALEILGDKWTAILLTSLFQGPKSFGDLEKAASGISPRTLSQRLEMLQEHSIITKEAYCQKPMRCNYELTAKGQELQAILNAMSDWSEKHRSVDN